MAVKVITFDEAMNDLYTEMANSWSKEEIIEFAKNLTSRIKEDEQTELRYLAHKYNYKLVPIKKYERFLPCKCGCNRRAHWSCGWAKGAGYILLKCSRCGFSVKGDTEAEAKRNWNEAIKGENND